MNKESSKTAMLIFGNTFPMRVFTARAPQVVIAPDALRADAEARGCAFVPLNTLVDPGSIQAASAFIEDLSRLVLPDGTRITKRYIYHGFELWWLYYNTLIQFYGIPYQQYRRLLEYLREFDTVYLHDVPHDGLFRFYLKAHERKIVSERVERINLPIHPGVILQIIITLVSLPILIIRRSFYLIGIGDKLERSKDHDFRMTFVYEELKKRRLDFVEVVRSIEPWRRVLENALRRRRPVIYSEAIEALARLCSFVTGERRHTRKELDALVMQTQSPEEAFKLMLATSYLYSVDDDRWAIKIMRSVLALIGVRSAFIPAASERSFHTVLACKLRRIPTVGIMHGVATPHSTAYDFMPAFDGEKVLSVDRYGVWSEWWRRYYIEYSRAYRPEQLVVSGPMRPLVGVETTSNHQGDPIRVLVISEQAADPREIIPYLRELLRHDDIECTMKFRSYRDGFEDWLAQNEPELLHRVNKRVVRGAMQPAIKDADVVIGSYSTAALEALLQLKPPLFMITKRWGDYYNLAQSDGSKRLLISNPSELIERIRQAHTIPSVLLRAMREQYFGDPKQNGSAWALDVLTQQQI